MTEALGIDELGGWRRVFSTLAAGGALDPPLATAAIGCVLAGAATDGQIGGLLVGLAARGDRCGRVEWAAETAAMVEAMLAHAAPLDLAGIDAVDIVGTGGSKLRQEVAFNISTTACFVVAGAGAAVCKHGNRKASSSSGSTDVLEALGIRVELDGPGVARCVREAGLGFAFARMFHPAMRHAAAVRAELGVPSVFNILGPLSHPARVRRHVIGVADPALAPLVVDVLRRRGSERAIVVHGSDGLDELTLTGPSQVWELRDGETSTYDVFPQRLGLGSAVVEDIGVGSPEANAEAVRAVLGGRPGPRRDIVLLNAAAGLVAAGRCDDLGEGLVLAAAAVDDGRAAATLDRLVAVSNAAG